MTQAIRDSFASPSSRTLARARASVKDLAQFQFPGDDVSDPDKTLERGRPAVTSTADETLERVRPSVTASGATASVPASATQEIDAADVLEVEPIEHHPSSVMPVALDVVTRSASPRARIRIQGEVPAERTSSRFELPRNRLGLGLGAAIFGTGCLVLALVNTSHGAPSDAAAEPQVAAAPAVAAAAAPAVAAIPAVNPAEPVTTAPARTANGVLVVSVNSLPHVVPTTGTIRLIEAAAQHRLYIDGAVQAGESAVVSCGRHMVKVGSAGTAHAMIIGCGEETVIAR